jgi:hypothetical protein
MSYNDFLGCVEAPTEEYIELDRLKIRHKKRIDDSYEFVRFGTPTGVVNFDKVSDERKILIDHFIINGYSGWPSSKISNSFKKHVAMFRASLDLWEELCVGQCMSKDEIYFRCLKEGLAFTDWVKKARSTSFRYHTAETNTEVEEEYLISNYTGYNALLSERYLIHWDDTSEIDDIKYAFMAANPSRCSDFRKMVKTLFKDFRLSELDFPDELNMIGALKNSSIYDPVKKRSVLMRELWKHGIDHTGPYFAKRRVVPTTPGSTRDTGVGDPGTIYKVKIINMLCRVISEKLPYSANADSATCNARYKRVLKRNLFLHLDFKKFGLLFPRSLSNIMLEEIGIISGLDLSSILIKDFFVEIDNDVYKTNRGSMLGWIDCLNSLCVCAILHSLSGEKELGFDFITFNDDVEISKRGMSDPAGTLELLRIAIVAELDSFDIGISLNKTFGSKCSQFLERYAYYDEYKVDMYKEQLTVKAYAQSLVTEFPWQAKFFHAAAEQWTKSEYATDRCIVTCPVEFRTEEASMSLWSGGWFTQRKGGLDNSLRECDSLGYFLGIELGKFKVPRYSTRDAGSTSPLKISQCVNEKAYHAYSSELALIGFSDIEDDIREINADIDLIRESYESMILTFSGRDVDFSTRIAGIVGRHFCKHGIG